MFSLALWKEVDEFSGRLTRLFFLETFCLGFWRFIEQANSDKAWIGLAVAWPALVLSAVFATLQFLAIVALIWPDPKAGLYTTRRPIRVLETVLRCVVAVAVILSVIAWVMLSYALLQTDLFKRFFTS